MHVKRIGPMLLILAGCAQGPSGPAPATAPVDTPRAPSTLAAPEPEASVRPAFPARWRQVSVTGKSVASSGPEAYAADGDTKTEWNPRQPVEPGNPQWLALPLEHPATGRLALLWHGHGMHYQNYGYGKPRTYEVEVSSDSTDGADGTWDVVTRVSDNEVRSRLAVFEAPGARWVRMRFTDVWETRVFEPFLREVTVYEATEPGLVDAWVIFGDSVTSVAFDPLTPYTFIEEIESRHPGFRPLLISGGVGGDKSYNAIERIRVALPALPEGTVVGMCYGSNDAGRQLPLDVYRGHLQAAIDALKAAGHVPILAVVPWNLNSEIGKYAQVCRELAEANGLPPGPDFYSYFKAHPEELGVDKVHPNEKGIKSIHRMWAEVADFRYPQ